MAKLKFETNYQETPIGTIVTTVTLDDKGAFLGQSSVFVPQVKPDKKGEKLEVIKR